MGAAAFKTILNFKALGTGELFSIYCTVTDIAGGFVLPPSGSNDIQLPSNKGVLVLYDLINTPTYGTDTTNMELFVNDMSTGIFIANAANQGATVNRQIMTSNLSFAAGARIKLIQRA